MRHCGEKIAPESLNFLALSRHLGASRFYRKLALRIGHHFIAISGRQSDFALPKT